MTLAPFVFDDFYQLSIPPTPDAPASSPNQVSLDIILGSPGQSADYTSLLDGTVLFKHEKVSHRNVILGDTSTLPNKVLSIIGNIIDMPGTNDQLTLDFRVKGGVADLKKSFTIAGTTGDSVNFSIIVRFF